MREGFQIDAYQIAEQMFEAVVKGGAHAGMSVDLYVRPSYDNPLAPPVAEPVDKGIVWFVGSRAACQRVWEAAQQEWADQPPPKSRHVDG